VTRIYDLVLWILRLIRKFPKDYKFWLGTRMAETGLDLLRLGTHAAYTADRRQILISANLCVDDLRHLFRLCLDLRLLSADQHEYAASGLNDIGRQVGGWMKAAPERA
jgi:hypothetical protein